MQQRGQFSNRQPRGLAINLPIDIRPLALPLCLSWLLLLGGVCCGQDDPFLPGNGTAKIRLPRTLGNAGANAGGQASDRSRTKMIPISHARQTDGETLPAPAGGVPIHPLQAGDGTDWSVQLPDKITEEPQLRRLLEMTDRRPTPSKLLEGGRETIRQRYPDGSIQLEREVSQDSDGNYFNHGQWRLYNRKGQVLAEGRFENGRMEGLWSRWHPASSAGLFQTQPYQQFEGPFLSTATFTDGRLDGMWTLFDRQRRKIFEIPYERGTRQGTASWWLPNALKMREVQFENGTIEGSLKEWNSVNQLVRHDEFIKGKKILRETSFYQEPKKKEAENFFLDSQLQLSGNDDWWEARPAEFVSVGERVQHGPTLAWHDNGQLKMKGQYRDGLRIGTFTWWHANGQKELEGRYEEGQKSGRWTWWHNNGYKSIEGEYLDNEANGSWTWWKEDGSVLTTRDLSVAPGDVDSPPVAGPEPGPATRTRPLGPRARVV